MRLVHTEDRTRDNLVRSRFEIYRGGVVAGYILYQIRDGRLWLLATVITAGTDAPSIESMLIQNVLLSAHRRRLAVIPRCLRVHEFLTQHPHFRSLIAMRKDPATIPHQ